MAIESLETLTRLRNRPPTHTRRGHYLQEVGQGGLYSLFVSCSCGKWSRRLEDLSVPLSGGTPLHVVAFWLGVRVGIAWAEHVSRARS